MPRLAPSTDFATGKVVTFCPWPSLRLRWRSRRRAPTLFSPSIGCGLENRTFARGTTGILAGSTATELLAGSTATGGGRGFGCAGGGREVFSFGDGDLTVARK